MKKLFGIIFLAVFGQFCGAQTEAYTVMVNSSGALLAPDKATFATQNNLVNLANAASIADKLYRDFFIYVDMAPSPQSTTSYYQANPSKTNDFYYRDASNALKRTVTSSGATKSTYIDADTRWDILWWTDFEIKVVDKYRNSLYFSGTIYLNSQYVINGHSNIIDKSPTIYYLSDRDSYDYYRCFGAKTQFSNFNSSIGATVGSSYKVSGVWFYPNLDSQTTINAPVYTGYNSYSKKRSMKFGDYIREIFTNPENTIIVWRQTTSYGEQLSGGRKRWIVVQPTYYGDFKVKTN